MQKRLGILMAVCAFAFMLSLEFQTAFGQGILAPSGPPAPTMKTLDQLEPRMPISSLPYFITVPGSYYLTTNLSAGGATNGITILTSNVVIDLRGFTLSGAPGANDGIHVAATITNLLSNITVRSGTVSGWPVNGLDADNAINSQFSDLNVTGNGGDGLNPGQQAIVRHCIAANNGLEGFGGVLDIFCDFENCDAHNNGDAGFYTDSWCTFKNCHANQNANTGFNPYLNCTFQDCVADDNYWGVYGYDRDIFVHCQFGFNGGPGIVAGQNCILRDSVASDNGDSGIIVSNYCTLTGCAAVSNQLDNIVTAFGCTLSQCTSDGSTTGNGFTLGSGNNISDSTAFGNTVNGIDAADRTSVRGCTTTMNGNAGIRVTFQGTVQQCTSGNNGSYGILSDDNGYASIINNNCSYNGILTFGGTPTQGAGIYCTNSPGCRIEGNTLDANYVALTVAANNHAFVLRNNASGNVSTSYAIGSGNSWGPIVDASAGGDISTIANSSHPDANFIH